MKNWLECFLVGIGTFGLGGGLLHLLTRLLNRIFTGSWKFLEKDFPEDFPMVEAHGVAVIIAILTFLIAELVYLTGCGVRQLLGI